MIDTGVYSSEWWAQLSRQRNNHGPNALYVGPRPPEPPFWSPQNPWVHAFLFAAFIAVLVAAVLWAGGRFEIR